MKTKSSKTKSDSLDGWKFAKTLKDMPSESGRYLIMNQLGSFFVGIWDAHDRKLHTQCMGAEYQWKGNGRGMPSQVRKTTGDVKMAQWDWKTSGRVYWKDVGDLDFYRIWQRCGREETNG